MSIINDLMKYRDYKCACCGTTDTYYDKINKMFKWYKTLVQNEAGFWCSRCYHVVRIQMKKEEE